MERLQRLFGAAAASHQPGMDTPTVDNAEMVYISSLALLKVTIGQTKNRSKCFESGLLFNYCL